ncbi:MAG: ATP-dependent helicase HrpB [Betaproteobacteria bacterium]|nr:ATP-dependent helicase HrpB [Betaproteobacteria bacterium]
MISLPIDALETDICEALKQRTTLILQAPPGSGKTTRVPQFLMRSSSSKILVLEPRRLAARMSAERISEEIGQPCGHDVGFQIRHERLITPKTRTVFMTEGLFLRTLLTDPELSGVDYVILDEFHERNMHSDIAFVMVRALQKSTRPDLKLIIMSATLDTEKLQEKIPDAALLKADVPTWPVEIVFDGAQDDRPLEWRVTVAVESLLADSRCSGDILVFLTGAAEIRRTAQALATSKMKNEFDIFELRAELPSSEQKKVFQSHTKRKVILSTNVAETSLTIPGVTGVVDSGLAKMASHAHWSGLPSLDVKPISQASATQRSGRAGRTAPGIARRLYTRADFQGRNGQERPEIQRMDLAQVMLEVGVAARRIFKHGEKMSFDSFEWLDPPNADNATAAKQLLSELGAVDTDGAPTARGEAMARWPLHPRLGRILEESRETGQLAEACLLASILNEGQVFKSGQFEARVHTDCDLHHQALIVEAYNSPTQRLPGSLRDLLDSSQMKKIERSRESLIRLAQIKKEPLQLSSNHSEECSPYARILLAGFPDRIVSLRRNKANAKSNQEAVFARGGLAQLSNSSTVQDSAFAIALEAEQVRRSGVAHFTTEITAAAGLSAVRLKELLPERVRSEVVVAWDDQSERVRSVERVCLDALVLEERQVSAEQSQLEQELFKQLKTQWPRPFHDLRSLDFFQHRLALLKKRFPDTLEVSLLEDDFELFLVHICEGKKSFAEIAAVPLQDYIDTFIPWELKTLLERELPVKIALNSGRKVEVNYIAGQPPWLSSRMQDFFGTMETPKLLQGSLPVTVHLLAPNGQSVQVTTDLANFWKNTYPDVKKEMSRRYPRHYWPDDPKNAEPLTRRPKPGQTPADTSRSK